MTLLSFTGGDTKLIQHLTNSDKAITIRSVSNWQTLRDAVVPPHDIDGLLLPVAAVDDPTARLEALRNVDADLPVFWYGDQLPEALETAVASRSPTVWLAVGTDAPTVWTDRVLAGVERYRTKRRTETLTRQRQLVDELNHVLTTADSQDGLEANVCATLTDLDPYVHAWVGTVGGNRSVEPDGGTTAYVIPEAWAGVGSEALSPTTIDLAVRQPVTPTVYTDPASFPEFGRNETLQATGVEAMAVLPLSYNGYEYGVLGVYTTREAVLTETDHDLLADVARDIAYALHSQEVYAGLREQNEKIETLHEVATEIQTCNEQNEVYQLLIDAAESVLEFDLAIADAATGEVLVPQAISATLSGDQYYEHVPIDAEDNVGARVYRTGESARMDDLQAHDTAPADPTFRSGLTIPIGEYGIFQTVAKAPNAFDEKDQKLAELLVAHVRERLAQLDREAQLRSQTEELKRQNERLAEFADIVGHDLRNPVNVAKGHLQAATMGETDDHLSIVADALDRAEQLLEDLLTLAKDGQQVTETEPIEVADLAADAWQTVDTQTATISIDTDFRVQADRSRFRQLVENLFRNAIEHSDGSVTIHVGTLTDPDRTGIYVADDGPGIPPEQRSAIFDRGVSTTDSGTGLGLRIVDEIATAHGWSISVTDSTTGGARFEIDGMTPVS